MSIWEGVISMNQTTTARNEWRENCVKNLVHFLRVENEAYVQASMMMLNALYKNPTPSVFPKLVLDLHASNEVEAADTITQIMNKLCDLEFTQLSQVKNSIH